MKTLVKYQGGKSKEMKFISTLLPSEINRAVEPFAGSAAFSTFLELPCLLGDLREDAITFFQVLSSSRAFELKKMLDWASKLDAPTKTKTKEQLAKEENLYSQYYFWRDEKFNASDSVEQAFRFIFLRSLCFSGMERLNSKTGKSNVPYGWYIKFNPGILKQWDIACEWAKNAEAKLQSWEQTLEQTKNGDFIFLDPPYLNRLGYSIKGFESNKNLHDDLASSLKSINIPWMIVHVDCEEYRELYSWANIVEKPFSYAQNFKGRDNSATKVSHLYITNY